MMPAMLLYSFNGYVRKTVVHLSWDSHGDMSRIYSDHYNTKSLLLYWTLHPTFNPSYTPENPVRFTLNPKPEALNSKASEP